MVASGQYGLTPTRTIYNVTGNKATLNMHPGQLKAWDSKRRIVAVLAGTQGGKTSFGPLWLWREIQTCGPGDYMVVTPTYPLLQLKALPEFLRWFEVTLRLGEYKAATRQFILSKHGQNKLWSKTFNEETRIIFGYAAEPESLEAATAKAAWLDEAGQKRFKVDSWEAIRRRLSIHRGRALITTTPYNLGWLKQRIWDQWKAGNKDIEVIRFESIQNPLFSHEEWRSARAELPAWKFDMFYRAIFTRPAGLIYDCFNEEKHKCPRFPIPDDWQRFVGLDFGGVNTAAVFFAKEPRTGTLYLYREYKAGHRTAREHTEHITSNEPGIPFAVGGSKSEGQWRNEFAQAGLPVREPKIVDVEVGINRVYKAHKTDQVMVFDDLTMYLDEKMSYGRKLDDAGEPTEEIEDKNSYHLMDAERYIMGYLIDEPIETEVIVVEI